MISISQPHAFITAVDNKFFSHNSAVASNWYLRGVRCSESEEKCNSRPARERVKHDAMGSMQFLQDKIRTQLACCQFPSLYEAEKGLDKT